MQGRKFVRNLETNLACEISQYQIVLPKMQQEFTIVNFSSKSYQKVPENLLLQLLQKVTKKSARIYYYNFFKK